MSKILAKGNGYQILYKERGEDSEKIAPSGMACLSRLDVPVPGIIAAADSGKRIRVLDKKYFLVCQGKPETEEGVMEDLLFHDSRSNRTFPVKRMRKGVKEARLSYKVLIYNEEKDLSYVEVTLDTGRTHQIRVHMSYIGHPLLGDEVYGRSKIPFEKRHAPLLSGQALHARRLSLTHPRTGERMHFECPLPDEFRKLIEILEKENA